MKVMKFGGTSLGSPERMRSVARLVQGDKNEKIVVLSAISGTTNSLVEISKLLAGADRSGAAEVIEQLQNFYEEFTDGLFDNADIKSEAKNTIGEHFDFLNVLGKISYSEALNKDILAQGELMSTKLFSLYLKESGVQHQLIPALDFMKLDINNEPQIGTISVRLSQELKRHPGVKIFVTQGFITRNSRGEVDNLKRGGSDYSASLIAAATNASVCEIWTDIDGMHNNDPRLVGNTNAIEQLSFEEAAELAYFGAKILHPASIWPAQMHNIPVKLKNTLDPKAAGTTISQGATHSGVKAVAAKDNITALRIKSSRMLMAHGFLKKVFDVFEKHKTSIDMITTSEVALSMTIDETSKLKEIVKELETYGAIELDKKQAIISVVGDQLNHQNDIVSRIFSALGDIPVRMVSYGGSLHNVSILIPEENKKEALHRLNSGLFGLN